MDLKLSAAPKGKPSAARNTKPAADKEERKYCDEGLLPNEVLFPHPLFVSAWLDESTLLVGGGGGSRFGFTNTLVVLQLHARSGRAGKNANWSPVGVLDLGEDVIWCISALTPHPTKEGAVLFAVSSVGCFYLLEASPVSSPSTTPASTAPNRAARWTIQKQARVPLVTDDNNPDKKPLAIAEKSISQRIDSSRSCILFCAQDDCTVVLYDCSQLSQKGDKGGQERPPPVLFNGHWRGRLRSLSAQALVNGSALLATVSEDAVLRFLLLNHSHTLERLIEVDEPKLRLPFRMMKSTLRAVQLAPTVHSGERALSATTVFLTVFDAASSTSFLISGALEYTKKSLHFEEQSRLSLPNESISAIAILPDAAEPAESTDSVQGASSSGGESTNATGSSSEGEEARPVKRSRPGSAACLLLATVDGNAYLCRREHPTEAPKIVSRRQRLHTEPISSIAVTSTGSWGAVVTTDIAQRAILTSVDLSMGVPRSRSGSHHIHLPALFSGSGRVAPWKFLFAALLILIIVLSLWGLSPLDGLE